MAPGSGGGIFPGPGPASMPATGRALVWHTTIMSVQTIAALVVAATAFLTAGAHVLADISGYMDRLRKTPIQQPPKGP